MKVKTHQESQPKPSKESTALDYLISIGLQNSDNNLEKTSIFVYLSEAQEKKVEEYCSVFGVSVRTMLNSCIQYVIFFSQAQGVSVEDLSYYPKRLGSRAYELSLNIDTLKKMKSAGLTELDEASKYAVAGIKVLYERTLNSAKRK
ncbi:MAG: hypothetical protein MUF49_14865 [Oculatellaceae cyanobacterium Prado106]|jgi:hypothetical protein|nr:hypothetical protein [Oculatellaceae cyanobacterium Prado106]